MATGQQSWRLVALSKRALEFHPDGSGTSAIPLPPDRRTRIGRAPENDVRLPPNWIQISSKHCELFWDQTQVRGGDWAECGLESVCSGVVVRGWSERGCEQGCHASPPSAPTP